MMDNENNGLHSGTNETPDTGYQNVGSSGTNTANTAEDFHAEAQQTEPPRQNENTQNENTAYDYSKNYTQDPQQHTPEHHNAPRSAKNGGGAAGGLRMGEGTASGYPDPGRTFLLRFFKTACFCGEAAIGSYGTSGTAHCAGKEHYADHCCGRG